MILNLLQNAAYILKKTNLKKGGHEHEKLKKKKKRVHEYISLIPQIRTKRGVATFLPNKVNFELTTQIKDKEGHFILVKGKMCNVYMPPGHDISFI